MSGTRFSVLSGLVEGCSETVAQLLGSHWAAVVDGLGPVHPFQGGGFDLVEAPPRPLGLDEFGLEQADGGFGQSAVVGVTTDPTQGSAPACTSRSVNAIEVRHVDNGKAAPTIHFGPRAGKRRSPYREGSPRIPSGVPRGSPTETLARLGPTVGVCSQRSRVKQFASSAR